MYIEVGTQQRVLHGMTDEELSKRLAMLKYHAWYAKAMGYERHYRMRIKNEIVRIETILKGRAVQRESQASIDYDGRTQSWALVLKGA